MDFTDFDMITAEISIGKRKQKRSKKKVTMSTTKDTCAKVRQTTVKKTTSKKQKRVASMLSEGQLSQASRGSQSEPPAFIFKVELYARTFALSANIPQWKIKFDNLSLVKRWVWRGFAASSSFFGKGTIIELGLPNARNIILRCSKIMNKSKATFC